MTTYHELWLHKVGNYRLVNTIQDFEEYGLGDFIIERIQEDKYKDEGTLPSDLYDHTVEKMLIDDFIERYEQRGGEYSKVVTRNERVYKFKLEWIRK